MHRIRTRSIALRVVAATIVVAACSTVMSAASAEASQRTRSSTVATAAERALDALERWHDTQRPAYFVQYLRARDRTAELLAGEVALSADRLDAEWGAADEHNQIAVLSALTQLGVKYRYKARAPGVAFDCSGLTSWAWEQAGVSLPRSSRYQIRAVDDVERDELTAGDLVYYPGHVSMYVGQGMKIHAPNTGSFVEVAPLSRKARAFGDPLTDSVRAALAADAARLAASDALASTSSPVKW